MKHFLFIVALGGFILSCKRDKDNLNLTPVLVDSQGITYTDNVSNIESEYNFPFEAYYTKLDTTYNKTEYMLPIYALAEEGDSVQITWNTYGLTPIVFNESKQWDPTLQKWKVTSALQFSKNFADGKRKIDRTVKFLKSGKSITRSTNINITHTSQHFDLGRINFGMSREEVKASEFKKFGIKEGDNSAWEEFSPTTAFINRSYYVTNNALPVTCYEFKDNKLNKVSELLLVTSLSIYDDAGKNLINTMRKLGNGNPMLEGYSIKAPQEWVYNGIKITYHRREFERSSGKFNNYCFTFEKL